MSTLKAAPAAVSGSREFDPEIKDMASYIHNYKIDSDLAVSKHLQSTSLKIYDNDMTV